jgi:hypothetical protein
MTRCELCEKESVCEVVDERDVVKSYCEDHAPGGAPSVDAGEAMLPMVHSMIDGIEAQLPHTDSIVLTGMATLTPGATVGKEEAQAIVATLRRLADFIRTNKRMPFVGEL